MPISPRPPLPSGRGCGPVTGTEGPTSTHASSHPACLQRLRTRHLIQGPPSPGHPTHHPCLLVRQQQAASVHGRLALTSVSFLLSSFTVHRAFGSSRLRGWRPHAWCWRLQPALSRSHAHGCACGGLRGCAVCVCMRVAWYGILWQWPSPRHVGVKPPHTKGS